MYPSRLAQALTVLGLYSRHGFRAGVSTRVGSGSELATARLGPCDGVARCRRLGGWAASAEFVCGSVARWDGRTERLARVLAGVAVMPGGQDSGLGL